MHWGQVILALVSTSIGIQSSPCSRVQVLSSWRNGFKAVAKMDVDKTVDHWDVTIEFSEGVTKLEAWNGHVTKISEKNYTISNNCYNNMVYSCQCFQLPYLVRHESSWAGQTTIKFNGELVPVCEPQSCNESSSTSGSATTTSSTSEVKKVFKTVVLENGQIIEQIDTFYPSTGEVILAVPAHGNFGEARIIMDGDSKVLMKSTDTACYIESIPDDVDPNDIKIKKEVESKSTEPITEDMEKKIYSLIFDTGTASADEISQLSPTMKMECANKPIKKTEEKNVDKETFDNFTNGKVITIEPQRKRKRRDVTVCDNPSKICSHRPSPGHCWRWPYGSGVNLHRVSGNGLCVPCCNSTSNKATDLCPCTEVTSLEKIKECISVGPNITCPLGFVNVCGKCQLDVQYSQYYPVPACNGNCLMKDRFLCGGECWPNKRRGKLWECYGQCISIHHGCNGTCKLQSHIPCDMEENDNVCTHKNSSDIWYCGEKCQHRRWPCNGTCTEGDTLCNYRYFWGEDRGYDDEECISSSKIWHCHGVCRSKVYSKPCDGQCYAGFSVCNTRYVYGYDSDDGKDECYRSSDVFNCHGKCQLKGIPCN